MMATDQTAGISVYDRRTGTMLEEIVLGDRMMKLAYSRPCLPVCRRLLFGNRFISRLLGWYCDTGWSRRKIARTIAELGIDTAEMRDPVGSFRTFNEFFTRHLHADARPFDPAPHLLSSPADARVTVVPQLELDRCVLVKGAPFTVPELLALPPDEEPDSFVNGSLMIARLCPADYHRFHYPAAGRELRRWTIDGRLDSVNPLALSLGLRVFVENYRVVTLLRLEHFGKAAFIEVGAFGVAGIVQTATETTFGKMDEKGCFTFGGSTIILVFEPGAVTFDPDLVEHSARGVEALVRAGETIGRRVAQ